MRPWSSLIKVLNKQKKSPSLGIQTKQRMKIDKGEEKKPHSQTTKNTINRHQTSDKPFKQKKLIPNHNDGSL